MNLSQPPASQNKCLGTLDDANRDKSSAGLAATSVALSHISIASLLRTHGLRATKARLRVGACLFDGQQRHVTATHIAAELKANNVRLAPASIYNVLNDFARVGLLRTINTESSVRWFDTNLSRHHHAIDERNQKVIDIRVDLSINPPPLPPGYTVIDYHITYRIKRA